MFRNQFWWHFCQFVIDEEIFFGIGDNFFMEEVFAMFVEHPEWGGIKKDSKEYRVFVSML